MDRAMDELLISLRLQYPAICYTPGKQFCWSPESREIFYKLGSGHNEDQAKWSLLHETAHALLDHQSYQSDYELIRLEVAAWRKAGDLATELGLQIESGYIQDCLDTYRDWLYARCACPSCKTQCLQLAVKEYYRCHNCHTAWKVTASRFARPYRAIRTGNAPAVFADTCHLQL
jgi:hypothetical protein